MSPSHSLVSPSDALVPGRRRENRDGRNLAGAAADGGNVAGAGEVPEIVGGGNGGAGTGGGELGVESFELLVLDRKSVV